MTELPQWTVKSAKAVTGGLSAPSKMPGPSYGTSAWECGVGGRLSEVDGSTCKDCYAKRHAYTWPTVRAAYQRRHDSLGDPQWTSAMIFLVARQAAKAGVMRWQDSGDLQSTEHLANIVAVAVATPTIRHWLPTREFRIVGQYLDAGGTFPANLTVRLSAHMVDGPPPFALAARDPQLAVSTVASDQPVPEGSHSCPAPQQGNECGDCRACWDTDVVSVTYHKH